MQANKNKTIILPLVLLTCLALALDLSGLAHAENRSAAIPFSEIGAKATTGYQGDALGITATSDGARLRCAFQKLEGRATPEGLWLESTVPDGGSRFRLTAAVLCRESSRAGECALIRPATLESSKPTDVGSYTALEASGRVEVADKRVRFWRPGVVEEYSVSVDGVRQDFLIDERLVGGGDLRLELALTGARAEAAAYGAKLTLAGSGRALAYSRLRAMDAEGKELEVRMEVLAADRLWVFVNDAGAVYPVRIDPTFSDANWVSMGGDLGANSTVSATVLDGTGNLYIGGNFHAVGDVAANCIAKWDGSSWATLGSGMDNSVKALAVSGTNLYAGGAFSTAGGSAANYVAKWDGSSWAALGSGMNNTVFALAVLGTNLYAGGNFSTADGVAAKRIAKWDGSVWSSLGSGMNLGVMALAVSDTNLYAGGDFTYATNAGPSAVAVNRIAKWDGSVWSSLGSGMDFAVMALAVSDTNLYAGGYFTYATNAGPSAVAVNRIAKWNGSVWSSLGSGMSGCVYALEVLGTNLYAGGNFYGAGGVSAYSIAKWNGSSWTALGSGINTTVSALAVSDSDVYAGGDFTTAGGVETSPIARWNGSSWSVLDSRLGGNVWALAVSGSDVYAGGSFTMAGGVVTSRIAKWNGSGWSPLGSGMNDIVLALAVSGTNLFAGGDFDTAGGVPAKAIAKWNGSSWSALGSGINSYVWALAVSGSDLYAGGSFTTAGGVLALRIAKWNGNSWSALGSGMDNRVSALAVSGSDVYAGGYFSRAGGVAASRIAKWNGSSWSALGSGMDDWVSALAVSGSDLYVGGLFTSAGGVYSRGIAKWNGSTWSALGLGLAQFNGWAAVYGLAVSGSDIYAGGRFVTASSVYGGGVTATNIAKWDGSSWSALGSGVNRTVLALAVSSTNLYAGGDFTTAGGKSSFYAARAIVYQEPHIVSQPDSQTLVAGSTATFFVTATGVDPLGYQWRKNGTNLADVGTVSGTTSANMALADVRSNDIGSYTVVVTNNYGSVTSAVASLGVVVGLPPTIAGHPQSQIILSGTTGTFSVAATGSAPLSYQWRKGGTNLADVGTISGVATTNLTIANVQANDAGDYSIVVTNPYGSVTSSVAVLTVNDPARTFWLPDYFHPVCLSNQWVYDGTDWDGRPRETLERIDVTSIPLTCFTGRNLVTSYTRPVAKLYAAYGSFGDDGGFHPTDWWYEYVVVRGGWGMIGLDDDPSTNEQRYDPGFVITNRVAVGQTIYLTNDVYRNGFFIGEVAFVLEVLEHTTVTVPAGTYPDCLHLRWTLGTQVKEEWWARGVGKVKKNGVLGGGSALRQVLIQASFASPSQITEPPQDWTGPVGAAATFSVTAIGTETLSYEWRKNGTNLISDGRISGVSSMNLTIANVQANDAGSYSVVVTNACCSVTSAVAVLAIQPLVPIIQTADGGLGVSAGKFGFNLSGPAGLVAIIEASTDLKNWVPIQTNALVNGQVHFTDTQSALFPKRFYRARFASAFSPQLLLQAGADGTAFVANQFGFNLSGMPGQTVVIEASTNLTSWTPLLTNSLLTGYYYFNDPNSANFSRRFYRAGRIGP